VWGQVHYYLFFTKIPEHLYLYLITLKCTWPMSKVPRISVICYRVAKDDYTVLVIERFGFGNHATSIKDAY